MCRNSAASHDLKLLQQNRLLFATQSSREHGRPVARRFRSCGAKISLSANRQHPLRRTIRHPLHRYSKPLRKNKSSSLKIHPSIHPNRRPLFHRSFLLRIRPRSRRSASRSRLAAGNRHRQFHCNLPSRQYQHKLHQQSSCPLSGKNRSQTPRRGKNSGAAWIFGRGKPRRPAPERCSLHLLYRELRRSGQKRWPHRTRSGKCFKRATSVLPEQPLQQQKSWQKRQKRPSRR